MPSNTPPNLSSSPLSISENRSQDCEEPPTDLSKFNMKANVNNMTTSSSSTSSSNNNNNNNDSNNNSKNNNNSQQFCLRWNNYQTNLTCVFDQLLQSESFVDVTLACDGNQIKAHKIVLSACSPYFQSLFFDNPCQHPIIIMRDVKWPELKAIVEFMYKGEINVNQDQISPLLAIAEMLQIRGLAEVNSENATVVGNNLGDTQISKSKQTPTVDLTAKSSSRSNESSPMPTFDIEEQITHQQKSLSSSSQDKDTRKMAKITPRDWESMASMDALSTQQQQQQQQQQQSSSNKNQRKRRWPSGERSNATNSSPDNNLEAASSPLSINQPSLSHHPSPSPNQIPQFHLPTSLDTLALQQLSMHHPDDMEIKPGIAEMIREEERAKLLENSAWLGASPSAESYQYQLQSMWQKCWNSQNLIQHMRFRERGPLKSWRPETMAEAIFSVLKEGLSLSQAARKYDIPYPTFVLYANRVHNMLGPSMDGGTDLRPKGRGRPQRILLGIWPDEHIKGVIKSVVFRDEKNLKEEQMLYGRQSPFPFQDVQQQLGYPNGLNPQAAESMSPDLLAAVRQQMCNMVDAANFVAGFNLPPNMTIQSMTPNMGGGGGGNSSSNVPNQKAGSPAAMSCNKNGGGGGESSNALLQMPRLESPALHLPTELSLHGLQNLSPNDDMSEYRKKEKIARMRKSLDELDFDDQQKSLNNNRLSITKMNSPKSQCKTPSIDALEPAVNLAISGQTLDMSYKSSRNSSDGSINGEDITRSFRNAAASLNFNDTSSIKLEPLADCRE